MHQNSRINYLLKPEFGPFHTQCVCLSCCLYQRSMKQYIHLKLLEVFFKCFMFGNVI